MRVCVHHSRHQDASLAVHNFGRRKPLFEVLARAHCDDPVFLHANARAFEHFALFVHRNQPRVGKNDAHRKSPTRLGKCLEMNLLWDASHALESAQPNGFAARGDFPLPKNTRSNEIGPAPKVASANAPTPKTNASPYMSIASGCWKIFSSLHKATAISPARSNPRIRVKRPATSSAPPPNSRAPAM